jgi:hypothetical protein
VKWKWNWTLFLISQLDLNFLKNKQEFKVKPQRIGFKFEYNGPLLTKKIDFSHEIIFKVLIPIVIIFMTF